MLEIRMGDISRDDWTGFFEESHHPNLVQSWEYGEAKARTGPWQVDRGLILDDGQIAGGFQAAMRRLPLGLRGGLVWINRAPLWRASEPERAKQLPDMLSELRRHYVEKLGFYLRVAPPVFERELDAELTRSAGFEQVGSGWASGVLDLRCSPSEVWANLRRLWRRGLRKAEAHGIAIRRGEGTSAFEEFLQRHARFLAERRFETSITVEFARAMQDLLPHDRKLEALLAEKDGEIVGSLLLAKYGNSWEYLASNLNERGRRLHAGRRLIWEAICLAMRENFERFDVGGFDPEASTGIQQFKRGLHPTPYRLAGEFEAMPRGLLSRLVRWRAQRRHG